MLRRWLGGSSGAGDLIVVDGDLDRLPSAILAVVLEDVVVVVDAEDHVSDEGGDAIQDRDLARVDQDGAAGLLPVDAELLLGLGAVVVAVELRIGQHEQQLFFGDLADERDDRGVVHRLHVDDLVLESRLQQPVQHDLIVVGDRQGGGFQRDFAVDVDRAHGQHDRVVVEDDLDRFDGDRLLVTGLAGLLGVRGDLDDDVRLLFDDRRHDDDGGFLGRLGLLEHRLALAARLEVVVAVRGNEILTLHFLSLSGIPCGYRWCERMFAVNFWATRPCPHSWTNRRHIPVLNDHVGRLHWQVTRGKLENKSLFCKFPRITFVPKRAKVGSRFYNSASF